MIKRYEFSSYQFSVVEHEDEIGHWVKHSDILPYIEAVKVMEQVLRNNLHYHEDDARRRGFWSVRQEIMLQTQTALATADELMETNKDRSCGNCGRNTHCDEQADKMANCEDWTMEGRK